MLQEEPPNMMTGPSPNDYYNEYVINYCVIHCHHLYHNRLDISSVPTPDMVKQQFYIPEDGTSQDTR